MSRLFISAPSALQTVPGYRQFLFLHLFEFPDAHSSPEAEHPEKGIDFLIPQQECNLTAAHIRISEIMPGKNFPRSVQLLLERGVLF